MLSRSPSNFTSCFLSLSLLIFGALAFSQSSTSSPPEQAELQRGNEALKKGDLALARSEFEKAVRLSPKDAAAQSALGWVLVLQGQSDAAIEHLRAAIQAKPSFVNARLTLASVLSQQGKSDEAEQEARAATKIAPENAEAHRLLAKILSTRPGDDSVTQMQSAVELE